jgi:hypothetical protein
VSDVDRGGTASSLVTPLVICTILALVLAVGSVAFGGEQAAPAATERPAASVATVARRVERIRGLRFDSTPRPKTVTAAQARREGLADLDRSYPAAERFADEELYKLLGLLSPRDDLRRISASVFGEQVAGYYDPRSGALRIVDGGAPPNRVVDETTIAHELTHALEDQRFDLDLDDAATSGYEALGYLAMVEGTATGLMQEYQRRHFRPEDALGGAAASAFGAPSTASLPPFVLAQLLFPYLDGERFIARLYATGGDTWRLVDVALRDRPPVSSEQILHPEKYLEVEQPETVRLRSVRGVLGPGWRRLTAGTFGEWQTREWLARAGGSEASAAAAGWGGDRYELWRRGPAGDRGCEAPCRARDALVLRWHWDTARDAAEFRAALDGALEEGLGAEPVEGAPGRWFFGGGAIAIAPKGKLAFTLAFAPDSALARRLSGSP